MVDKTPLVPKLTDKLIFSGVASGEMEARPSLQTMNLKGNDKLKPTLLEKREGVAHGPRGSCRSKRAGADR